MKRTLELLISLVALCGLLLTASPAAAALCFNCGSGSSNGCKQCRSRSGKDTSKDRKLCKKMGCKITGYGSCSTAANVKVCSAAKPKRRLPAAVQQCSPHFPFAR